MTNWQRFIGFFVTLFLASLGLSGPAQALTQPNLVVSKATIYDGYSNSTGIIEFSYPSKFLCFPQASGTRTCAFRFKARWTAKFSASGLSYFLTDKSGKKVSASDVSVGYLPSSWGEYTVNITIREGDEVGIVVTSPLSYFNRLIKTDDSVALSKHISNPKYVTSSLTWPEGAGGFSDEIFSSTQDSVRLFSFGYQKTIAAEETCQDVVFRFALLDDETGDIAQDQYSASFGETNIWVEDYLENDLDVSGGDFLLRSEEDRHAYEASLFICGLPIRSGEILNITISMSTTITYLGTKFSQTYITREVEVVGSVEFNKVACKLGKSYKVFDTPKGVCPGSWQKVNIAIKNGKLVKSTIRCLRGLTTIKVTDYQPACPSGYRRL